MERFSNRRRKSSWWCRSPVETWPAARWPPELLAERTYEPDGFDKAYRANFTGYHYTLELELPESLDPAITSATVKATFTEAVTGHVLTAELIVGIKAE